jgi:hypothetical protein
MRTDQEFEKVLRSVSVHETAHTIAAWHFEIAATPRLPLDEDGDFMDEAVSEREAAGTPFEQSCIGWAGIIGEAVTGNLSSWLDELPWKLSSANLEPWHWTILETFDCLSRGDQIHIQAFFDPLKSCRFAFKILIENLDELKRLATELSAHTLARRQTILTAKLKAEIEAENRRWTGTARPENFPTDAKQFTAMLCGGDKNRFQQFKEFQALLHLTGGRTADLAELHSLFNGGFESAHTLALSLQDAIYAKFTSGDAWLRAVQQFRRFEAEQTINQT